MSLNHRLQRLEAAHANSRPDPLPAVVLLEPGMTAEEQAAALAAADAEAGANGRIVILDFTGGEAAAVTH